VTAEQSCEQVAQYCYAAVGKFEYTYHTHSIFIINRTCDNVF